MIEWIEASQLRCRTWWLHTAHCRDNCLSRCELPIALLTLPLYEDNDFRCLTLPLYGDNWLYTMTRSSNAIWVASLQFELPHFILPESLSRFRKEDLEIFRFCWILRIDDCVVQLISFCHFQNICWYKLIVCWISLSRIFYQLRIHSRWRINQLRIRSMVWLRLVCFSNYRSLLRKSPIKETISCKRDL